MLKNGQGIVQVGSGSIMTDDSNDPAHYVFRSPNQGQARKLLNGGLPEGQEALKAATARPWADFDSIM
jgi:hypothetical protein